MLGLVRGVRRYRIGSFLRVFVFQLGWTETQYYLTGPGARGQAVSDWNQAKTGTRSARNTPEITKNNKQSFLGVLRALRSFFVFFVFQLGLD
jgi:hypothetical protein